ADLEALVGHRDPADSGLASRERIFRRLGRLGRGQGVEKGRLADVRQADNPTVKTHDPPTDDVRHDRACPGHPRDLREVETWMAGTSPAMTVVCMPGAAKIQDARSIRPASLPHHVDDAAGEEA